MVVGVLSLPQRPSNLNDASQVLILAFAIAPESADSYYWDSLQRFMDGVIEDALGTPYVIHDPIFNRAPKNTHNNLFRRNRRR
jgi:hypothetical protein